MKNISRRKFIGDSAKGAALITAGTMVPSSVLASSMKSDLVPRTVLGKTGLEVSMLSFGGGSQFQKNKEGEWQNLLEEAVKRGVNLFDTAPSYSTYNEGGTALGSDQKFGVILSKYREKVRISTKLETRDPKKVREEVMKSLSSLNTDYVDILQMHGINDQDNVDEIEKGTYKVMQEMKKEGIVRFIGFSSMSSAAKSQEMLEKLDVDVALLAFNPTMYGNYWDTALPAARKQNSGVMAMKIYRNLVGEEATPEELFEYGLSLEGVHTVVIGHVGVKQLKENVKVAKKYAANQLAYVDHADLEARLAQFAGPHKLCWAHPDYTDGIKLS
jgi:uncharacterized protein